MLTKNSFSFSADCKTLEQSIKKVAVVAGPTAIFFLGIHNKSVCILGLSTDTFALLAVPNATTSDADGIFAFDQQVLQGLVKGRSIMNFKFTGSECQFSQVKGKYSGKLTAVDVTDDQIAQLNDRVQNKTTDASALSADILAVIKQGLVASSVNDVYQNTTLLSYVTIAAGRLIISSFDAQHFGLFRTKINNTKLAVKVALPRTHFSMVEALSGGMDMKLSFSTTGLRAFGKGFIAVLPAAQADDKHFTLVQDFLKSLPKPVYEGTCDLVKLLSLSENLFTLYNANSNFLIRTKGKLLNVGLSTSSGSASDSMNVATTSPDTKLSVDPRLFMDILNICKPLESATLRVMDKVVSINGKSNGADLYVACSRVE